MYYVQHFYKINKNLNQGPYNVLNLKTFLGSLWSVDGFTFPTDWQRVRARMLLRKQQEVIKVSQYIIGAPKIQKIHFPILRY